MNLSIEIQNDIRRMVGDTLNIDGYFQVYDHFKPFIECDPIAIAVYKSADARDNWSKMYSDARNKPTVIYRNKTHAEFQGETYCGAKQTYGHECLICRNLIKSCQ